MSGTTGLALVLAAYLLGSVSFSYLIVRIKEGKDVRKLGAATPGPPTCCARRAWGPRC